MNDNQIVELFWKRSESAITEIQSKYGKYCHSIAFNILHDSSDSDECVNDTYLRAWNSIPPHRPNVLSTFLGKITRNLALNRYEQYTAQKRGCGQIPLILDELENCISESEPVEQVVDDIVLAETLNRFLANLPIDSRRIFVRRYWYFNSITEISTGYEMSESKIKMILFRARNNLKKLLEEEGVIL